MKKNILTCNMDEFLKKQLHENGLTYKNSLTRIIDKYSKLQYQDGGIEVDLENTNPQKLEYYMKLSQTELSKLESKSLTDLRNESLRAQDITRDSELGITHQDGETDRTLSSTTLFMEDEGMASSDIAQLTELQPEDQDEELEMTLRCHGTLVELYPSMISRLERAWHRKNVCNAADSVLRRYRRWRQPSNRNKFNNTSVVALSCCNSRQMNSKILVQENLQDWKAQHHSPGREKGLWSTEQQKPILVMDLSGPSEASNPQEISFNETFTVSKRTQLGEEPYSYSANPSQSCYPTAKATLDQSLRAKRPSLTAHSEQAFGCSVYAMETTAIKPDLYGSPVRQSPLKARMLTSFSGSPDSFSRSPQKYCGENFSSKTARPRSLSTSLSSPLRNRIGKMRTQDSNPSIQLLLPSLKSARAEGRFGLRQRLSFNSSQPLSDVSCSPKALDKEIKNLYHKFVCENKSSVFSIPPCCLCGGNSGANHGRSLAFAALALSPHRSVLRKRSRDFGWESHPESKRSREEYTASPGSKRHGKEVLRHSRSSSELEQHHDDFRHRSSKRSMFPELGTQQHSADTWMMRAQVLSAAEFSGLGT